MVGINHWILKICIQFYFSRKQSILIHSFSFDDSAVPHRPHDKIFKATSEQINNEDVTAFPAPADIMISNEHTLLLPAAISIYEMKYIIWNSNIFTYCDVKSKQHKCYKRSFFHSESKSQSPIKMNLFFYNSAVPRRPHDKVFQASSNVWSCSPAFFFCSDVVGPYIISQISAFFLFSNFRKGRLLYIHPVGWSVGWSVGWRHHYFFQYIKA